MKELVDLYQCISFRDLAAKKKTHEKRVRVIVLWSGVSILYSPTRRKRKKNWQIFPVQLTPTFATRPAIFDDGFPNNVIGGRPSK